MTQEKEINKIDYNKKISFFRSLHYMQYWPLQKITSLAEKSEELKFNKGDSIFIDSK